MDVFVGECWWEVYVEDVEIGCCVDDCGVEFVGVGESGDYCVVGVFE